MNVVLVYLIGLVCGIPIGVFGFITYSKWALKWLMKNGEVKRSIQNDVSDFIGNWIDEISEEG